MLIHSVKLVKAVFVGRNIPGKDHEDDPFFGLGPLLILLFEVLMELLLLTN